MPAIYLNLSPYQGHGKILVNVSVRHALGQFTCCTEWAGKCGADELHTAT